MLRTTKVRKHYRLIKMTTEGRFGTKNHTIEFLTEFARAMGWLAERISGLAHSSMKGLINSSNSALVLQVLPWTEQLSSFPINLLVPRIFFVLIDID